MKDSKVDELENLGFKFLAEQKWPEARVCFEKMLELLFSPMRQTKVLWNIVGTYEKEGNKEQAIITIRRALQVIDDFDLFNSDIEGARYRGLLRGQLHNLEGNSPWNHRPPYSRTGPIETNLSWTEQLFARFAAASVGAASGTAISYVVPLDLKVLWFNNTTATFASLGMILAWLQTKNLLEKATSSVMTLTGKDEQNSLRSALSLLVWAGFFYVIAMPFILWDVFLDVAPLLMFLLSISFARKSQIKSFWHAVVFIAGLYYGIVFFSGNANRLLLILAPPAICLGTAIFDSGGVSKRVIRGAFILYMSFLLSFTIGYAVTGAEAEKQVRRVATIKFDIPVIKARRSADVLAKRWNKRASLIHIDGPGQGSRTRKKTNGTIMMIIRGWSFLYLFEDKMLTVNIGSDSTPTTSQDTIGKQQAEQPMVLKKGNKTIYIGNWQDAQPIPEIKIDFKRALAIAASNGGQVDPEKWDFMLRMWKMKSGRLAPVWATPLNSPMKGPVYVRADTGDVLWEKDLLFE